MARDKVKAAAREAVWRAANPERVKAIRAKTRAKNREKNIAKRRAYDAAHPEEVAAKKKASRMANIEKVKARERLYQPAYRAANPEKVKANARAYYAANPARSLEACRSYRASRYNAPINDFTHEQWVTMQAAYDHRCVYCGKRRKGKLTQDHIQPLSKGGSHTLSNIVPACQSCNSRKNDRAVLVPVQPLLL